MYERETDTPLDTAITEYIKNMPSLPTSVTKVLEICNNFKASPADLNYVISLDPVLVGRILKLINSAYYGFSQQITSLVRAIIMLGMNTVKNLALSTAIMASLASQKSKDFQGLDMEGFWQHSLCVGVASKSLAIKRGIDLKLTEEYFTAGLLHDLGKIPLNAVLHRDYMNTVSAADRDRLPLFRSETRDLKINHTDVGALIVKAWQLEGGAVGDVIIHHHRCGEYTGPYKDILYSVAAANYYACFEEIGFAGDRRPEKPDPLIRDYLGPDEEFFDETVEMVHAEIEKARVFLKL
ncbi:MAG: HDOD domain-containing protein [Spirochaetaceae bacterium]|jgi:HD-like signal output (HDOD) protein|nr:HDOD domain-containing protein [Spirochaetaceae bacterium]